MSDLYDNPNILRSLIMDHYQYPRNKGLIDKSGYIEKHMSSESCIDDIKVFVKLENGIIEDIKYDGVGCTISIASTSMMSDILKGKTINEAKNIINNYINMVEGREYEKDILSESIAMKNVYKQANRIKCASIGINGIKNIILESEN